MTGSENRQGHGADIDLLQDLIARRPQGRRRRRRCGAVRRHLAVACPPARQDREARTLGGPGSRAPRVHRPAAGDRVLERPLAEDAGRAGRARRGDGAHRAGRPVLRPRRSRRDRPRLAEPRHARPRGAQRRNADRAGARRRGGGARGRGRHQFRRAPRPAGAARSVALAASNGFAGGYAGSSHADQRLASSPAPGTGMERDYDFANAIYAADLRDPAEIGKSAGERAVKRLGAKKMPTCRCPVVFDPRVARGFISHLLGAISGPSIARGTSFLKDKLGQRIFPEAITIIDDPHRQRGLRSKPFDGEGIANRRRAHHRQGRADDLAARSALGAPARPRRPPAMPRAAPPRRPRRPRPMSGSSRAR